MKVMTNHTNNQTAVDYLYGIVQMGHHISKADWEHAKRMEREQIIETWKDGNLPTNLGRVVTAEEYYNETYGAN